MLGNVDPVPIAFRVLLFASDKIAGRSAQLIF
jgi:hypothetical protein